MLEPISARLAANHPYDTRLCLHAVDLNLEWLLLLVFNDFALFEVRP